MKIRIEDIMFWILIALIIGVAIWKLIGSPTDTATLISVALFFVGSEILLWKTFFSVEKKTAISFIKIKGEIEKQYSKVNINLNEINLDINNIKSSINKIETLLTNKRQK